MRITRHLTRRHFSRNLLRTQPKRMLPNKLRFNQFICTTILLAFILSLASPTDSQNRPHLLDQTNLLSTNTEFGPTSSESDDKPKYVEKVSEERLTISDFTYDDRPTTDHHGPEDQWPKQRYTNQSLGIESLPSSPMIIQDHSPSTQLYPAQEPTGDNGPSGDPDHRLDSSPLRLFFPSARPTALAVPQDSSEQTGQHRDRSKRWVEASQAPSYPGTDTVYATKTVTVTPGEAQPTLPPGSPTVVIVVYANAPGNPGPTPNPSTVTLANKPGNPAPYTTTIYPPGVAVATVTVMSSANTKFEPTTRSYRSIYSIIILISLGFIMGCSYLL